MEHRNRRLDKVYQDIHDDPKWDHLRNPGINLVPGYGNANDPKVLLVGEAPGATENSRLRPFCGPSGRVLNHLMGLAGIRLDDVDRHQIVDGSRQDGASEFRVPTGQPANAFVTNVIKYRPPGNRTPTPAEIWHAKDSLRAEWRALAGPKVVVCVGGVAHAALSPVYPELSVTAVAGRGAFPARDPQTGQRVDGYWFVSMLHPAYGLRRGEHTQRAMSEHWQWLGGFLAEEGIL